MNHLSTPPARRRAAAVVVGVLLALAALLVCKPWATAATSRQAPSAAATAQQEAHAPASAVAGPYAVGRDEPNDRTSAATSHPSDVRSATGASAKAADVSVGDISVGDVSVGNVEVADFSAATTTTTTTTTTTATTTGTGAVTGAATGTKGEDPPGCQDDRRGDNGAEPSVPPRSGSSYDHGPLLGERAVPGDRAAAQALACRPAVPVPSLPASTPVRLSVVQRV
ncbi:hypothetical protein [Streptomyces sp. NPDC047108]|uniref:hypothetical protein n=1 Tax=Streptomyces sp. NPDC047108 TaxID=3155025 RepID=UPI0033D7BF2F